MDFVQQAKQFREIVETELARLFAEGGFIGATDIPESLRDPMSYAFLTGGKRLRPVICLAACQAVSGNYEAAVPAALAIEALHTYTLVHDDLPCMDNDMYRRGQLTVHAKYGYGKAVLVGDALQAVAFDLAMKAEVSADVKCAILSELLSAAGPAGVIGGQWVDVTAEPPHDAARVAYVHQHKTADLICCALAMGGAAGGATAEQMVALRTFGYGLGVAFQIIDDLLDADDPEKAAEMGILHVVDKAEATRQAQALTQDALAALDVLASDDPSRAQAVSLLRNLAEDQMTRTM